MTIGSIAILIAITAASALLEIIDKDHEEKEEVSAKERTVS